MRISLTNSFFLPKVSGSIHFTRSLAEEFVRRGHDVQVITCTPAPSSDEFPFEVVRLSAKIVNLGGFSYGYEIPFLTPAGITELRRTLRRFQPDVLHLNQQFFDLSHYAGLWGRKHSVPRILTLHTAFNHNVPWRHQLLRLVDRTAVSPLLRLVDPTIISIDKFMDSYARDRFRSLPRVPIPIPVRAGVFDHGDGPAARARLGIGTNPMILSLGHVIPLRDRLAVVEALPILRRDIPEIRLVVVGHVYDDRFLQRAARLGVEDHVITVGQVPHADVRDFVAAADVECHDTSGFGVGTATLEIMGSGVAVAAVIDEDNFPGVATVEDGVQLMRCESNGDSVAKALLRLMTDDDLRSEVEKSGRQFVADHFDLAGVADRYLELFRAS